MDWFITDWLYYREPNSYAINYISLLTYCERWFFSARLCTIYGVYNVRNSKYYTDSFSNKQRADM
jgi:hypothetical protein